MFLHVTKFLVSTSPQFAFAHQTCWNTETPIEKHKNDYFYHIDSLKWDKYWRFIK